MGYVLKSGTEFTVNSASALNQTAPSIANLAGGGFIVVWGTFDPNQDGDQYAIKGQRFDAAGHPVGGEFLVNSEAAGAQATADVATFADGSFVVTWIDQIMTETGSQIVDVKARLFDSSGAPLGSEFLVNSTTVGRQDDPHVTVLDNGNFVISWNDQSDFDMKAQIFTAQGARVGGEFRLNTHLSGFQEYGDVVALEGGGFVATWRTSDSTADGSGYAVIARVFDSSGVGGSEFRVNTATAGDQYSPSIAALAVGGFVVTWYTGDATQDGSSGAVKAQRYDAAGNRIGSEFLVNTLAANLQNDPAVATTADGGFVIVWQTFDAAQDGSGMALKGQYFDASGQKIGSEFLVNSLGTGAQFLQAVTVLADGTLAAAWASESGDGSGYAIRARLFDLEAPPASPVIQSDGGGDSASIQLGEGQAHVTTVAAMDRDSPTVAYAITGGADASLFTIDAATGELAFAAAPDFEAPADGNGDNVYEVIVSASDGALSDSQTLSIAVVNVNEAPVITSDGGGTSASFTLAENGTAVTTVTASDVDSLAIRYAIVGGNDAGLFAIDEVTGVLTFIAAPDFEAPADFAGDNFYTLTVAATDGALSTRQNIEILVADVNEAPVIGTLGGGDSAAVTVGENSLAVTTVTAADPEGQTITYAISGGADAALFAIDPATGALAFVSAPNFEAPADANGDNVYDVIVRASDGVRADTQALAVTVANLVDGVTLVGTNGANSLVGTAAEDRLSGLGGSDTLAGGGGSDMLDGGKGNDTLIGGGGSDVLIGGEGADQFVFQTAGDSAPGAADIITDFSHAERDRISLRDIDANANVGGNQDFSFIGTNAFTGIAGQLRYEQSGGNTLVMGDVDGDRVADFAIQVTGPVTLVGSDFLL